MPTLNTPKTRDNLWTSDRLFGRYGLDRGVTLAVKGAAVTILQYPLQDDLAAYDKVYMGGHTYTITQAEADTLTAAGYGSYITP